MNNDLKKIVTESKRIISKKNAEIKLLKTKLTAANGEKSVVFKMPDEMTVANFPTIIKTEVTNHQDTIKANILNLKDIPTVKFPDIQKVHIINHFDGIQKTEVVNAEKASAWVPSLVQLASEKIMGGIAKIVAKGIPVTLSAQERQVPLTVVVVDINGDPIDMTPPKHNPSSSPGFPMIMHGNVTTIAGNCVSGSIQILNPGIPVNLPNVGAKRIVFTAPSGNGGLIAIGGSTVNASIPTGSLVYPTGSAQIDVNNANVLWIDGTNIGDIISYNILS